MSNKLENNIEVEYKFWAGSLTKEEFQSCVEKEMGKLLEPVYACSCDDYYVGANHKDDSFIRYRKGSRQELTLKCKREGNFVRKEINLNMENNDDFSIVEFLKLSGYEKKFSVFKEAWIFDLNNECEACYYTLSTGESVIELEAINQDSVESAVQVVDKWSKALGLSSLEREYRSLFEIYGERQAIDNLVESL